MSISHIIGNEALICHAYNKDYTQMVVSINTPDIFILDVPQRPNEKFVLKDTLKKHSLLVTSLDWSKNNNVILSGSADREAYVWVKQPDGKWKATLTVLQNNRAVTSVLWSPLENKFAAGTGSKCVSISDYQAEFDIWSSKQLKKSIKSTVTCIDWHPNNVLIAVGSTDFRVRVFSAYLEKIDPCPEPNNWGTKMNFGYVLYETQVQKTGWIHDVKFNRNGSILAFVSHNSTVSVVDATSSDIKLITYKHGNLPFLSLVWGADATILCAGHDCCPIAFYYDGHNGKISQGMILDQKSDSKSSNKLTAMKKFQNIDRMATSQENFGSKLSTIHQNSIRQILPMKDPSKFSTIGLDGQLVIWDFDAISKQMKDLACC